MEGVISVCRDSHSRARFCVGVWKGPSSPVFWLPSLPLLFLVLCLAILVLRKSLFNSSVGIAVKFDLKCKDLPSTFHLFPTVSNLRERSRRHVGLIEFGLSMKKAEIAFGQAPEIR